MKNVKAGYSETVCVKCTDNRDGTMSWDSQTFKQKRDCSASGVLTKKKYTTTDNVANTLEIKVAKQATSSKELFSMTGDIFATSSTADCPYWMCKAIDPESDGTCSDTASKVGSATSTSTSKIVLTDATSTATVTAKGMDSTSTVHTFCAPCLVQNGATPVLITRKIKISVVDCATSVSAKSIANMNDAIFI